MNNYRKPPKEIVCKYMDASLMSSCEALSDVLAFDLLSNKEIARSLLDTMSLYPIVYLLTFQKLATLCLDITSENICIERRNEQARSYLEALKSVFDDISGILEKGVESNE